MVVGRTPEADGRPTRPRIVFTLANEPGALVKALAAFALRGRRPDQARVAADPGRPWEYLFYVDSAVGRGDPKCARALVHLAEFARPLRTLGSYPSWKSREAASPEGVTR